MKVITMLCSLVMLLSTMLYAQTSEQGRITGTVLNEDGQPVVHAVACVLALGGHKTECNGLTDQGGQFEIQHLSIGTFSVFATKEEDGYSDQGPGQQVVLTPQDPSANITIKLKPKAGILIGTVTDSLTRKPWDKILVIYAATDGTSSGNMGMYMGGEFRCNLPTTSDLVIIVSALGYKPWVYSDPDNGLSLHLASGEQKLLDVELVPDAKKAKDGNGK
jgi:hypothetical protein